MKSAIIQTAYQLKGIAFIVYGGFIGNIQNAKARGLADLCGFSALVKYKSQRILRIIVYIYASTEEILKKAIKKMPYKFGTPLKVNLTAGDIFTIDRFGRTQRTTFDTDNLFSSDYYHFPYLRYTEPVHISSKRVNTSANREYIEYLKSSASFYGFSEDMVEEMLNEGYTTDDIEEVLYCGAW